MQKTAIFADSKIHPKILKTGIISNNKLNTVQPNLIRFPKNQFESVVLALRCKRLLKNNNFFSRQI
ncbi:hypothetical protein BpHYR1_038312 [Brachionus plicatilis]|uniref:Uncharacterized protein n=1 Tax=Brachionus plicatilis TaxID=10195 RepID=A0A3M7RYC2_BRAPC|nr:hypothetical protein BpHYR1_038312 [Brachionus plicatilis]